MKKSSRGKGTTSIRRLVSFDRQSYSQLRQIAIEEERPFSWEVRRAIRAFLENQRRIHKKEGLAEVKRKMLAMGVSKEVVDLVGTVPMPELKDEKEAIADAIYEWASEKEANQ